MPTTRVLVTRDGKIVVEGIGYIGDQCLADLQRLQQALASLGVEAKIEVQQKKPEAYAMHEEVHESEA